MRQAVRIFVILGLLAAAACGLAGEPGAASVADREVIVKWRAAAARLDAAELAGEYGIIAAGIRPALPVAERTAMGLERVAIITTFSAFAACELSALLAADSRVEYAELRPERHTDGRPPGRGGNPLDGVPDDPFYAQQWGLHTIEAEAVWNITRGASQTVIAVVDIGVDFTHPELRHARWENPAERDGFPGTDDDGNGYIDDVYGYDFVDGDGQPWPDPQRDVESHGTHVAGIIAAQRNNSMGIAGLAPDCRIMAVRAGAGNSIGFGYDGIYYAARSGARVINCSWGGGSESAFERDVIAYALERGCIVVAAAGNGNTNLPHYPAAIEGVLSVAATAIGDAAAAFTHYGPWVKLAAPGVDILSTVIVGSGLHGYASWQGTSMAAPLVAAVCGLVAARDPGMDGRSIMARVNSSSDPIDVLNPSRAGLLGIGRVNAWRAIADSLPGLRLGSVTFEESAGNGDGRIRGGERADLRISVFNHGAAAGSVAGLISSTAAGVVIRTPQTFYGGLPPGGPYWNSPPVSLELTELLARGFALPLTVDWLNISGRVIGRALTVVELDSTFVSVENGRLKLGFAEHGSLGYYDYESGIYRGTGFVVGDHSNALFHGSFLLAADGLVSDNAYGNAGMHGCDWVAPFDSVAHFVPDGRAPVEARAVFDDLQAAELLFARVNAAALAWRDTADNGFIILEYAFRNRSVNDWNEAYAGFFLDWDLGSPGGNVIAYDPQAAIAYVRQTAPGHPLAGVVPLTNAWGALRVIDNRAELDDTASWNDARKWELLRGGLQATPTASKDWSLIIAAGPFRVAAHAQRTEAFALVTGQSVSELQMQAARALAKYNGIGEPPAAPEPQPLARVTLFPNPVCDGERLQLYLPRAGDVDIRFYNILGQLVAGYRLAPTAPGEVVIDAPLRGSTGLLFYRIESPDAVVTGKLLVLK